MPRRNYGFEKRQKELARKQRQEEKKQRKRERSREAGDEPSVADLPAPPDPGPPADQE